MHKITEKKLISFEDISFSTQLTHSFPFTVEYVFNVPRVWTSRHKEAGISRRREKSERNQEKKKYQRGKVSYGLVHCVFLCKNRDMPAREKKKARFSEETAWEEIEKKKRLVRRGHI